MTFGSPVAYTIAGAGANALTVDVISGRALIDVSAGSHTIAAPLVLAKDAQINVAGGSALTVANLQPGAATVIKQGAGTLNVNGAVSAAALDVQAGLVKLLPGEGGATSVSRVASLAVAGSAKLDLGRNALIVANGDLAVLSARIASAYNFGAWDGDGIMTSQPDAAPAVGVTTLAIATAEQALREEFGGFSLDPADVLIMYTYAGDANFDGLVDAADYGVIDNFVQFPGTDGYANGDFNYDGVIDAGDYGIIDNTIQLQGAPLPAGASAQISGVAAVPEPAACGIVALAATALSRRRRRRRRGRGCGSYAAAEPASSARGGRADWGNGSNGSDGSDRARIQVHGPSLQDRRQRLDDAQAPDARRAHARQRVRA
jgi:hypothetical protein